MIGLGVSIGQISMARSGWGNAPIWTPAANWPLGTEPGLWYDPSSFANLYQDSAGTSQVTAMGQPVGRILDLSGRGNVISQPTASARPLVSSRVNLLTKTEDFADAAWSKGQVSPSTSVTPPPANGPATVTRLVESVGGTLGHHFYYNSPPSTTGPHTASCYFKAGVRSFGAIQIATDGASKRYTAVFNLTAGIVTSTNSVGTPVAASNSIVDVGGGWFRVSVTATNTSGTVNIDIAMSNTGTPAFVYGSPDYSGDGASDIFVTGAQLETGGA